MNERSPTDASELPLPALVEQLLAIVREVAVELHRDREATLRVALDSDFDGELGFDSLGRAELLARVARRFAVTLPEELLATSETPYDVLSAVLAARAEGASLSLEQAIDELHLSLGPVTEAPERAHTLIEVLDWHARQHGQRPHVLLSSGEREIGRLSYAALDRGARERAAGLRARGLIAGDRVAIMLATGEEFFNCFFAVLYAGGVPVPIYPPTRAALLDEHLRRQAAILRNAGARVLITQTSAALVAVVLREQVAELEQVVTPDQLRVEGDRSPPLRRDASDLALLQYTSGSTGDPKGVMLTHANLLANIRAMRAALAIDDRDLTVSWLPLYHDMGLIGAWLTSLFVAAPVVVLSPLAFLIEPSRWLRTVHRHRATITVAPNFAYELCLRRVEESAWAGLDLSSLRLALCGAEPVSPTTMRDFAEHFGSHGLRPEALLPVYGLAENAVGLAFPPLARGLRTDVVDRRLLDREGVAVAVAANAAPAVETIEFVCCGRPLPGHELRVIAEDGHEASARQQGRLQFRGPSACDGYFANPEKSAELCVDVEWRETGDLAYIADGELFITGRSKDIIIRAGRNIYPQELEERIGELPGIRRGCVAVFGAADPQLGTERLIVLAETREQDPQRLAALRGRIDALTASLFDAPADDVILAPPHTVRKTSSGKIRRALCRALYESGELSREATPPWLQLLRLGLAGVVTNARSGLRSLGHLAYAAWWWIAGFTTALILWPVLLLLPTPARRWAALRRGSQLFFRATAIPIHVGGEALVPDAIVVANHQSYVDSLLVAAVLPGQLAILAKRELENNFASRSLLSRAGVIFVERYDPRQALMATEQAAGLAGGGRNLMFFPEGATTRRPGLAGFRLGAFTVAVRTGLPVQPVVIRGSRNVLRGQLLFPRHGAIEVEVGPAMTPIGDDWQAAVELRDRARAWILARCGEPDLGGEEHPLVTRLRRKLAGRPPA